LSRRDLLGECKLSHDAIEITNDDFDHNGQAVAAAYVGRAHRLARDTRAKASGEQP